MMITITVQYRDSMGWWQYPGCSREEATFESVRDACDAIDSLTTSDPETWADAGLTIRQQVVS